MPPVAPLKQWLGSRGEFDKRCDEIIAELRKEAAELEGSEPTANAAASAARARSAGGGNKAEIKQSRKLLVLVQAIRSTNPKWCWVESEGNTCSNNCCNKFGSNKCVGACPHKDKTRCGEWHLDEFLSSLHPQFSTLRQIVATIAMEKKYKAWGACTYLLRTTTCDYIDPDTQKSQCYKAHPIFEFQFADWKFKDKGPCVYVLWNKCNYSAENNDDNCPHAHPATRAQLEEWKLLLEKHMEVKPDAYDDPARRFVLKHHFPRKEVVAVAEDKAPNIRDLSNRFACLSGLDDVD